MKFPDLEDASRIFLRKLFISICLVFPRKVSSPFLCLVGTQAQLLSLGSASTSSECFADDSDKTDHENQTDFCLVHLWNNSIYS